MAVIGETPVELTLALTCQSRGDPARLQGYVPTVESASASIFGQKGERSFSISCGSILHECADGLAAMGTLHPYSCLSSLLFTVNNRLWPRESAAPISQPGGAVLPNGRMMLAGS